MFTSSKLFAYIAFKSQARENTREVRSTNSTRRNALCIWTSTIKLAAINTRIPTIDPLMSQAAQYPKIIFVLLIGEMSNSSKLLNIFAVKKPNEVSA